MKKQLSLAIAILLCVSLCACGSGHGSEINTTAAASAAPTTEPFVEKAIDELQSVAEEADARTLLNSMYMGRASLDTYIGRVYHLKNASVVEIMEDYCVLGGTIDRDLLCFHAYLPADALISLTEGDTISLVGEITYCGAEEQLRQYPDTDPEAALEELDDGEEPETYTRTYLNLRNVYLQEEAPFVLDPDELKTMIDTFGDLGEDGVLQLSDGSFPWFIDNRESFTRLTAKQINTTLPEETWNAKYYLEPDKELSVTFFPDGTTTNTLNSDQLEFWYWESTNNTDMLSEGFLHTRTGDSKASGYEVRQVTEDVLVLYLIGSSIPSWILYK